MAMSLRMVSLVASRFGSLSVMPIVSSWSCRLASKDAKAWLRQSHSHKVPDHRQRWDEMVEDPDMADLEDKVQAVVRKEIRRQKTVKYQRVKRQMTSPGAPERRLSWDAMQQIRYLKLEQPEEWTVEQLAKGFSVSPDVILRVLRSKFTPTLERKAKQDASVLTRLGQQALPAGGQAGQDRPGHSMLPAGTGPGALVTLATQSLMPREDGSRALATSEGTAPFAPVSTQLSVSPSVYRKHASLQENLIEEEEATNDNVLEEEYDDESWDGRVFSEEELEELMLSKKFSPVVQNGKEFFDSEGNFLYRI